MALSANTSRPYEIGQENSLPVKASAVIYRGSAVGLTSGYARALTAGDLFGGFAEQAVTGTSADGGARVNVRKAGYVQLSVTSVAVTDIGKPVYASDDGTFTLTQSTNSHIGSVARFVSSGIALVKFDATPATGLSGITALTDNSAGTADGTIQAMANLTDSPATADALRDDIVTNLLPAIRNNFAEIAAQLEVFRAAQK